MAIISTDIKTYLTGGAINSDPTLSLGGTTSSTEVSTSVDGIFADTTPAQAAAGVVCYRAITVKNTHATLTLTNPVVWISTETSSTDDTVALGYDSTGTQSIANETTAPASPTITFSTPTTKETGISIGTSLLPNSGNSARVWLRRTTTAGAASVLSSGQLSVTGSSIP